MTAKTGVRPEATPWGEHSGAMPLYWNLVPPMKRELQWKNWLTQAVKVVIVNCNGTIVVVPFVQCQ